MSTQLGRMSDETFKALEEEYQALTTALSRKISSLGSQLPPSERENVVRGAEGDIYEAEGVLKKMEIELRHFPYNKKAKAQNDIKLLRNSLELQKRDFERARDARPVEGTRVGRMKPQDRQNQRNMLLDAQSSMDTQSQSLRNTQNTIERTTEVGVGITNTLQAQREQLLRSREAVRDTDDTVTKARKTLQRMARRVITNKLILGVVIVLELAAIGLIVWKRKLIK